MYVYTSFKRVFSSCRKRCIGEGILVNLAYVSSTTRGMCVSRSSFRKFLNTKTIALQPVHSMDHIDVCQFPNENLSVYEKLDSADIYIPQRFDIPPRYTQQRCTTHTYEHQLEPSTYIWPIGSVVKRAHCFEYGAHCIYIQPDPHVCAHYAYIQYIR